MHQFNTAGRRDGPIQPTAAQQRQPRNAPTGSPRDDHKPGSARPHAGTGGTRNMAQASNASCSIPGGY